MNSFKDTFFTKNNVSCFKVSVIRLFLLSLVVDSLEVVDKPLSGKLNKIKHQVADMADFFFRNSIPLPTAEGYRDKLIVKSKS